MTYICINERERFMNDHSESLKIERDGCFWAAQNCQICEAVPTKFVGKRGGNSHRENLGSVTFITSFESRDWCVNLAPTFEPFHVFGFRPKSLKKLLVKHGLVPKFWK